MMKISSFSLCFVKQVRGHARHFFAAVAAGMTLVPFGPLTELLKKDNPWHGFYDKEAVFVSVRAQKIEQEAPNCEAWIQAVSGDALGVPLPSAGTEDWRKAVGSWSPWTQEELEGIASCDKAPCFVKLNAPEAQEMARLPAVRRFDRYLELVRARIANYARTGERKEYEYPGAIADPWKVWAELGLKSPLSMSATPELWVRRTDLLSKRLRIIREVMDRRVAIAADRKEVTLWRRDAYTDHHFDGVGEWVDVRCDAGSGTVVVTQSLFMELDQMKSHNFFDRLMRSKMRGTCEENGANYLDQWFQRLRAKAKAR